MSDEILRKLEEQDKKIEAIYSSVEKTRRYFAWTLIFNLVVFLIPLLAVIIIIPWFLRTITSAISI